MMDNKGYTIVLDALLALIITVTLFAGLWGSTHFRSSDTAPSSFKRLHYVSEDALDVLNKNGALDEIGSAWAEASGDNTSANWSHAANVSHSLLEQLIPPNVGYRFYVEDNDLAENVSRSSESEAVAKTHSVRLLVGYGSGLPTRGEVARAYLTNIKSKTSSAYAFFDGFVGEGNITQNLTIPSDADAIIQAYVELDSGADLDLYVNGMDTGCCSLSGGGNMSANVAEYIANPSAYFNPGENLVEIKFTSGYMDQQYIGGGHIRVTYNTTSFAGEEDTGTLKSQIPGIDGLINLYSSFYVPGELQNMHAHLEFISNYSTYMTVGDEVIYEHQAGDYTNKTLELYDDNLSSVLNYGDLSLATVPFRIGTRNISIQPGIVDIMLVEDRSESLLQNGWLLESHGDSDFTYTNVSVPNGGWSEIYEFNVSAGAQTTEVIRSVEAENFDRNYDFQAVSDSSASNNQYMWTPEGAGNNWDHSANTALEYDFTVDQAGDYIISARVRSQDGENSDSFWVSMDNGTEYLWSIQPNNGSFSWDDASNRGGPDPLIWTLNEGSHTLRIELREDGAEVDVVNITKVNYGKLAASITWDNVPGYNGSENSEFVVNLRRPDGSWIFDEGENLPDQPNAGGFIDPPTGNAGGNLEYFSGISTKPQTILVYGPSPGTWVVAVYGWNLRPMSNPPASMPVDINVYIDETNQSDNILRGETVISYNTALDAAKSFVDNMVSQDKAGYVVFGNSSELKQGLTFDHNAVKTAIDNTGVEGGTAINLGIDRARQTLALSGRPQARHVMIVLSDGENDGSPNPVIAAAQEAKDQGIRVFAIGLSSFANQDMLKTAASSPDDYYYAETGAELKDIYQQITQKINATYHTQQINMTGEKTPSILYPTSYIEFNYTPQNQSSYEGVEITLETDKFNNRENCTHTHSNFRQQLP